MYRVFSRQTESGELACCGTALGIRRQAAASMHSSMVSELCRRDPVVFATQTTSHAAQSAALIGGSSCTMEREATLVIPDVASGIEKLSPKQYRRSCHGTVLDDEQQGGTAVRGSWPGLPRSANHSIDGIALVTPMVKASHDSDVPAARKDVDSRCQLDQEQQRQQVKGRIIHLSLSKDAAAQPDIYGTYATPFAAPEVQACTCHMRYKRCKQHPRSRIDQLAGKLRHLFACGGCLAVL